jgi:hypothetical protein
MLNTWRKQKAEAKAGEHSVMHKPGSNVISRQSDHVGEDTPTYSTTIRYLCLPDTVDPRGPKGNCRASGNEGRDWSECKMPSPILQHGSLERSRRGERSEC